MSGEHSTSATRRHIAAVTLGNALEFYDFLTYSFFAIQIGHCFFPSESGYGSLMASLATFGAGFATRPLGALVIGQYADRVGRKPAMLLSFVLIGLSIFAMALIPSYRSIGLAAPVLFVAARMLQGFSLGGEIGSNTAYLVEAAPPATRGFIVSFQGASQMAAVLAGSVVGVVLSAALSADALTAYGWRIAFALGGLVVPLGWSLRRRLPETLHAQNSVPERPGTRATLAREHWGVMTLGLAILGMGTIGSYVQMYIVTFAQHALGLSARAGFFASCANAVAAIPALLLGGWLSDRFGRWPVNVLANALLLVLVVPLFAWTVNRGSPGVLIVSMTLLGFVSNLTFGVVCAALGEGLPHAIRSSAFGTVYSLAMAVFGGSTEFVVTWLIHLTGSAMAPAWYVAGATAVAQVALMMLPETAPVRIKHSRVTLKSSAAATEHT
jgi:MFS family permease